MYNCEKRMLEKKKSNDPVDNDLGPVLIFAVLCFLGAMLACTVWGNGQDYSLTEDKVIDQRGMVHADSGWVMLEAFESADYSYLTFWVDSDTGMSILALNYEASVPGIKSICTVGPIGDYKTSFPIRCDTGWRDHYFNAHTSADSVMWRITLQTKAACVVKFKELTIRKDGEGYDD